MVEGRLYFYLYISRRQSRQTFVNLKKTMFAVAALLSSHGLSAQDSTRTRQMDEVVVTATRSELKQSQTGKVMTVIDRKTLERSQGKGLGELLTEQAGIHVNGSANTVGTNQDLYFRGASTGNVLVLLDGVPVNDPSQINTYFDLNHLQTDQVERIEILKGAQSTLWGSNAMAGVINIITRKAGNKVFSPTLSLSQGSYGTTRWNAGFNGRRNKWDYLASYGQVRSRGFSSAHDSVGTGDFDKDGYHQDIAMASVGYRFNDHITARYTGNYSTYRADIDAGAYADDRDYLSNSRNLVNGLVLTYQQGRVKWTLSQTLLKASREVNDDSLSIGGFNTWSASSYTGTSSSTDLTGNIRFGDHVTLVTGAQYLAQGTDQEYRSLSIYGPFNSLPLSRDTAVTRNVSLFASLLLLDMNRVNAEAGMRYNHHSLYGGNATYTFNTSWSVRENARMLFNVSSAYKTPSLYQLYSEYGNKTLRPEYAVNIEAGFQVWWQDKRSSLRVVGFKRDIRNLIIFYTDPNTYESRYMNRDEQHDLGVEMEASLHLGNHLSATTNLTYVDGKGISEGVKSGNLYRRPHVTANAAVTWTPFKKFSFIPSFRLVGNRASGPYDPPPATMPSYYTIDLYAGYTLGRSAKLFLDLRNLTDQRYFEITGYNSRGRNLTVGFSVSL